MDYIQKIKIEGNMRARGRERDKDIYVYRESVFKNGEHFFKGSKMYLSYNYKG